MGIGRSPAGTPGQRGLGGVGLGACKVDGDRSALLVTQREDAVTALKHPQPSARRFRVLGLMDNFELPLPLADRTWFARQAKDLDHGWTHRTVHRIRDTVAFVAD